ncbi:MAG: hypothetical protein II008_03815 [Oscillospiraceae bacterium]|nr:hypothetical protein [Oscillospiraceae bacterium]
MNREIKWTQWSRNGMTRCGHRDYKTIMGWMRELGMDAKKCVRAQEKDHAIYGRVMHDDAGRISEIRFYCDTYLDDQELDTIARANPTDTLYVAHK